jgi:hypothetical protein
MYIRIIIIIIIIIKVAVGPSRRIRMLCKDGGNVQEIANEDMER